MRSRSKYHNKKVTIDGISFDSKREAKRYQELKVLEKAGEIQDLELQKKFVLIPSQYEVKGHTPTGKPILKCVERECSYVADFVYSRDGQTIVEDTKGFRTTEYILKRKMMLFFHGIRIKEL